MNVLIFPSYKSYSELVKAKDFSGPVCRVFKDMERKYPRIHSLVNKTFEDLKEGITTLDELEKLEKYGRLKGSSLWEFRIPPKGTSGVFRGYCKQDGDTVYLYAAEIKKNFKKKADKKMIKEAEFRHAERIK